jgi:hypothetical protein
LNAFAGAFASLGISSRKLPTPCRRRQRSMPERNTFGQRNSLLPPPGRRAATGNAGANNSGQRVYCIKSSGMRQIAKGNSPPPNPAWTVNRAPGAPLHHLATCATNPFIANDIVQFRRHGLPRFCGRLQAAYSDMAISLLKSGDKRHIPIYSAFFRQNYYISCPGLDKPAGPVLDSSRDGQGNPVQRALRSRRGCPRNCSRRALRF